MAQDIHTHTHTHTHTQPQNPGTVTFLELALDFEEFAQRTLPHSPQAKFKGTALSLQERGRVLRLAVANAQRPVTKGQLHPARVVTRCSSLVPLGGGTLRPELPPLFYLSQYHEHTHSAVGGIL